MSTVTLEDHGNVAILRLSNGVTNAISFSLVEEMLDILGRIKGEYRGLILAGNRKFFSIGLNLPELLKLDRKGMDVFWDKFDDVVFGLYTLPIPTATMIAGHATAGGTILALTCDYRFAAPGRNLMGLNEVNIGLPVPYLADLMLRATVSERAATSIVYRGGLIEPDVAQTIQLIDEVHPEMELETRALEAVEELATRSQPAFSLIKKNRTEAVRLNFEKNRNAKKKEMLDCWFRPEVLELLEEAAKLF